MRSYLPSSPSCDTPSIVYCLGEHPGGVWVFGVTQQPPQPPQGGAPSVDDPTGTGGGNIAPGQAPEPGAPGFTGEGGGANGGNPQPQQPQGQPPVQ